MKDAGPTKRSPRKRRARPSSETRAVKLAGWLTPGEPLDRTKNEPVEVPVDLADDDEELYRVVDRGIPAQSIRPDDILVVQPRPRHNAATAELVLVEFEGRAYVGRWWAKRGRRAVVDDEKFPIVEGRGVCILGVVTVIARMGLWR